MKKKSYFALLCAAILSFSVLCGCGSTETSAKTDTAQTETAEAPQPMTMGKITAIDGATVTLQPRGGGRDGMGDSPMDDPSGDEIPEGMEAPADGEMPEMKKMESITIDLADFDAIDVTELAVGDMLSLEMDADSNVTAVAKVDMSQMPEIPQGNIGSQGNPNEQITKAE